MSHYKPYPAYKDSGVEWLGQVPVTWGISPLWAVATVNDDERTAFENESDEFEYVDISTVTLEAGISKPALLLVKDAPSRAQRKAKSGDIVVSTVRTYLRAIGKVLPEHEPAVFSTGFAIVRANDVSAAYLYYALLSEHFLFDVEAHSTGVSYPAINASDLMKLKILIPTLVEQQEIAKHLDRETARIDGLIGRKTRFIELLREKRQALITHAVTKGLDPNAPMKDTGVEWLGDVPAHWKVTRLKFIASVQTGVAKGKDNAGRDTIEVPYLRVANVQDGYLALDDVTRIEIPREDVARYRLQYGDVLMNEGGDFDKLGRGHIWKCEIDICVHQNHVFAVRPTKISSAWLNTFTSSTFAQFYFMSRAKQSTNLASISSTNIMELPIPLPPESEQDDLLQYIISETNRIDTLISTTESSIELLKERRSALITAAVTGQIDLRETT